MRSIKQIAGLMLCVLVAACDSQAPPDVGAEPELVVVESEAFGLSDARMQQFSRSCVLCHVTGVAQAPLVGNIEQWQPRLEQGKERLLAHTLEGFNSMPPLGYCMSCDTEDFSAMIDFMVGEAR